MRTIGAGSKGTREGLLALAVYLVLFLLSVGSTLTAPLSMHEEHRILTDAQRGPRLWARVAADDTLLHGRVRPVFMGWHFGRIVLFGARPQLHHALILAVGVLTAWFLRLALRDAGADGVSALLAPPLVLLSASQGDIWFMLFSAAETVAMPFAALSLWGVVRAARRPGTRRHEAFWLGAAVMAALAKESFTLVLPGLALLRLALEATSSGAGLWRTALNRRGVLLAALTIFALLLGATMATVLLRPQAYGPQAAGLTAHSFRPLAWWALLRSADVWPVMLHALAALPVLALLVALAPSRREALGQTALALTLVLAWTVPQAILYSGGMVHRYVLPALVAPAALYAWTLSRLGALGRPGARWLYAAGWLWAGCTIVTGVAGELERSSWWGAEARSTARAVAALAAQVPPHQSILTFADPATGWGFESCFALPAFLRQRGWAGSVFLAPARAPANQHSPANARLAEEVIRNQSVYRRGDPSRAGAVLVVSDGVAGQGGIELMELAGWRELVFPEPYWVRTRFALVKRAEFVRRALVRGHPASEFPSRRPLVRVDPTLAERVGVNPLVVSPYGLEILDGRTVAWLGPQNSGALEGVLWAKSDADVHVDLTVAHGPSRRDSRRTVRLTLGPDPTRAQEAAFEGGAVLRFDAHLAAGPTRFRVEATDRPTIRQRANGDPRLLLVLVRDVFVSAL